MGGGVDAILEQPQDLRVRPAAATVMDQVFALPDVDIPTRGRRADTQWARHRSDRLTCGSVRHGQLTQNSLPSGSCRVTA
jgi:hypothetical protein